MLLLYYVSEVRGSIKGPLYHDILYYFSRRLVSEHEQLEVLMVQCHEKLKENLVALAEQRDSTLKGEKFRVKSFEELQQRYLKLQEAGKKLLKVSALGKLAWSWLLLLSYCTSGSFQGVYISRIFLVETLYS